MDTGDYRHDPTLISGAPVMPAPRSAMDYNFDHPYRGYCLILENENFSQRLGLAKRIGSERDAAQLVTTFGKLGFDVYHQKDLSQAQTKLVLKQIALADHSDRDCLVCIVLTHGDYGSLYASDGRYLLDDLFCNFLGNKCPSLVGKPKMFFVQACQGNRLDGGVLVQNRDRVDSQEFFKIPTHADFLVAYSSVPGFYSFRNTEKGSWFINSLVEALNNYHHVYDLQTILTIVTRDVAFEYSSQAARPEFSNMKQVPCVLSMLTRRVFFSPKATHL